MGRDHYLVTNPRAIVALVFLVFAVCYHLSYSRFCTLLRKEKAIDLIPEEPPAKHLLTDFKSLKFLLTRQYREMGQEIRRWGDLSLACCILGWICLVALFYLASFSRLFSR